MAGRSPLSGAARLAVSATLALVVGLTAAPAASAHAILLRTEPSPQTTVDRSPGAVKLHFSEPAEVAFGAIRVFDVDGHRVDDAKLSRADANREVDVAVPKLRDGSYTVTWRVVSADGHPVHGGFSFYVGAPSTISAVAVAGDAGVGGLLGAGFGAERFVWFVSLFSLIGLVVVRHWVWTPAMVSMGMAHSPAADLFRARFARALPSAWLVLLVSGSSSLILQAATASGLSLAVAFHLDALSQMLHTAFGRLWLVNMGLTLAAGLPVFALVRRRRLFGIDPKWWIALLLAVGAGLCGVAALNGHARTLPHEAVGVPSVAIHLLAVSVWVGGLGALVLLGRRAWRAPAAGDRGLLVAQLVRRFSRVGVAAVLVVVATGVLNALLDLGALSDLWRVRYGQLVTAKVLLLGLALALAARHRWVVPRRLADAPGGDAAVTGFGRSATVELAALAVAAGLAAGLVAIVPGRSLALAANGPVNRERRAGPFTIQLFIDPTAVGPNEVHVTYVDAQGLGAAEVANTQVELRPVTGPPQIVAMRLISPGHFVGDVTLAPGPYQLEASTGQGASTTFDFRLRAATPAAKNP